MNGKHHDVEISVGTHAWLSIDQLCLPDNLLQKPATKFVSPYPIVATIASIAFHMKPPPEWKIYDLFYASWLKPIVGFTGGTSFNSVFRPLLDFSGKYEVEKLLDIIVQYYGYSYSTEYLVKWYRLWPCQIHLGTYVKCY